jgi:hypothetical protein
MPTIITYTPLQAPTRSPVKGRGRMFPHRCEDVGGHRHQQRLPLGSVRGILYLDALCLHCGTHFVWDDDEPAGVGEPSP